jgi:Flp pilus assembly protein TadG
MRNKGQIIILFMLMIPVFLGVAALTVDVGNIWLTRVHLQTTADAAALSAAKKLPSSAVAESYAEAYTQQNGFSSDHVTITTPYDGDANKIRVQVNGIANFTFGRIFGLTSRSLEAHATAYRYVVGITGSAPLAVGDAGYVVGDSYQIKTSSGSSNYGAIALGGNGASTFRDNLKYGYNGSIRIGDHVDTEPGKMTGPTKDGVDYRLGQCHSGCTWNNYEVGCPKLVVVAVTNPNPTSVNGRTSVTITGFKVFFLESGGSQGQINARYLGNLGDIYVEPVATPVSTVQLID